MFMEPREIKLSSPDGAKLATADRSGGIHLWEASSGGIIVTLAEHKDSANALTCTVITPLGDPAGIVSVLLRPT